MVTRVEQSQTQLTKLNILQPNVIMFPSKKKCDHVGRQKSPNGCQAKTTPSILIIATQSRGSCVERNAFKSIVFRSTSRSKRQDVLHGSPC